MRYSSSLYNIMTVTLLALALGLTACQKAEQLDNVDLSSIASPPETMTIRIKNYNPQSGNVFKNIFVSNFSVSSVNGRGQLQWSSARDGLPDTLKATTYNTYGFSSTSPESVVTGFADIGIYMMGLTLAYYPNLYCATNQMGSTTNDVIIYNDDRYTGSPTTYLGFRDCEKSYFSLNPNKWDYNNNGIPDYLEFRCGMSPLNGINAFDSTSGDGLTNLDHCKMHIPIDESYDTPSNLLFAYKYEQFINADNSMDFKVSNIPIMQDGADNMLVFYVTETNLTTNETSLYTAYAILKAGYTNKTLQFDYWATDSSHFFNQPIVVP